MKRGHVGQAGSREFRRRRLTLGQEEEVQDLVSVSSHPVEISLTSAKMILFVLAAVHMQELVVSQRPYLHFITYISTTRTVNTV